MSQCVLEYPFVHTSLLAVFPAVSHWSGLRLLASGTLSALGSVVRTGTPLGYPAAVLGHGDPVVLDFMHSSSSSMG